ncbi:MAG: hypothetical protein MJ177_04345 [Clostridia bacterium]|nr:hypothetical protein [Clostridia bacterium]
MAADLVQTVLDAESVASRQIEDAKDEGQRLIEFTVQRMGEYSRQLIEQAKEKAAEILENAESEAEGEIKKSENISALYVRKLISETEKKYPKAIDAVISCILNN